MNRTSRPATKVDRFILAGRRSRATWVRTRSVSFRRSLTGTGSERWPPRRTEAIPTLREHCWSTFREYLLRRDRHRLWPRQIAQVGQAEVDQFGLACRANDRFLVVIEENRGERP